MSRLKAQGRNQARGESTFKFELKLNFGERKQYLLLEFGGKTMAYYTQFIPWRLLYTYWHLLYTYCILGRRERGTKPTHPLRTKTLVGMKHEGREGNQYSLSMSYRPQTAAGHGSLLSQNMRAPPSPPQRLRRWFLTWFPGESKDRSGLIPHTTLS